MNCQISFIIGISLIGASIYTMTVSQDKINLLNNKLSSKLKNKYKNIIENRKNIYIQGLILGLIISYILLRNLNTSNKYYKVMSYFTITMIVTDFYYLLMPKEDYILNYLKTEDEKKTWLEIYKTMRNRYTFGMLLGFISSIPISNSLCK